MVWSRKFSEWQGKYDVGLGLLRAPLVDGDSVLCTPGGPNAMIVSLDKKSGKEIWASAVPQGEGKDGAGYSSIVVSEGGGVKQYVQDRAGSGRRPCLGWKVPLGLWQGGQWHRQYPDSDRLRRLRLRFDRLWRRCGTPELKKQGAGNKATVTADEVYFLEAKTFQNHHGGMIQIGDYIYAGHQHDKGFPICLELKTGNITWGGNIRPVGEGSAAITCVGDKLIFRYQNGRVALSPPLPKATNRLARLSLSSRNAKAGRTRSWSTG